MNEAMQVNRPVFRYVECHVITAFDQFLPSIVCKAKLRKIF